MNMKPTNRQPRVSFTGYYGMQNYGDDLFGLICRQAASRFWGADVQLVCPPIEGIQARYSIPHWFPAQLYGGRGPTGQMSRLYSFAQALATSDILVLGGGSTIHSRRSFRQPLMIAARELGHLELGAVGVSIGPFHKVADEAAAAQYLRQFSYISVRDRRSYDMALDMGLGDRVHDGRDLAGLLPLFVSPPRSAEPERTPRLGIALCNYGVATDYHVPEKAGLLQAIAEAVARVSHDRLIEVVLFSLNEHPEVGDRRLTGELERQLIDRNITARVLHYSGDPGATARAIGSCDAFMSARLHGALTAYVLGIPFAMIDYHPKCRDFADDVGLPETQRIDVQRHDATSIRQALENMLSGTTPALAPSVYSAQALAIFENSPWMRTR